MKLLRLFTANGLTLILSCLLINNAALAQSNAPIRVGMSAPLSGPSKRLGQSMRLGITTYFQFINQQGGINGQPLELVAYDDGYNPDDAAKNMMKLLNHDQVIAVIGNVGTPTAKRTIPIASQHKTLLFGAFSGANILRKSPPDRYVFNFRASYDQETASIVAHILSQGIRPSEIALFTQNDEYGQAGYDGVIKALKTKGYQQASQVQHHRYQRNTQNVEPALWNIYQSKVQPKAVIIVGTYNASAKFIQLARPILPQTKFYNISFVGSVALADELAQISSSLQRQDAVNPLEKNEQVNQQTLSTPPLQSSDIYISQVMPHFLSSHTGVEQYRELMQQYHPNATLSYVSLEAFLMSKVFIAALKKAKKPLTRAAVVSAFEQLEQLDIGIESLVTYSPDDHQGLDTVYGTRLNERVIVPDPSWQ